MGTINVYAQTGTTTGQALWTQSGDLGEKWFEARIDVIPSADFKVRCIFCFVPSFKNVFRIDFV